MIGVITAMVVSLSPPPKPSPHRGSGRRELHALVIELPLTEIKF